MSLLCWNCGENLDDVPRPISRHASCPRCFNELHCCRLCKHYDPKRNMLCFEDRAEPPLQKENANFCDFFSPRSDAFEPSTKSRGGAAKAQLDSLFGSNSEPDGVEHAEDAAESDPAEQPDPDEAARKRLDDLFNP